ncbi:MAG TPA: plastocyanin/azurin family copper-binding protein [Candidatus Nanopelagicaceae bacterium]|nr:plastocyanin/azurin family copper-binding protein [Candidatus Nanopelagicaceae bacterium]
MLAGRWHGTAARVPRRGAGAVVATLVLGGLLAGCGFFGDAGTPGGAHIPTQPGNQVKQTDSNLKIKAITAPPKNPEYRIIIYHNVNTVGAFVPDLMTVPVGATVEWVWTDEYDQHNVWWIDQNLVNSPTKGSGYRWAVQFLTPGTYDYYCTLHPGMQGTVIVKG